MSWSTPARALHVLISHDCSRIFDETSGDITCVCKWWVGLGWVAEGTRPVKRSQHGHCWDGSVGFFLHRSCGVQIIALLYFARFCHRSLLCSTWTTTFRCLWWRRGPRKRRRQRQYTRKCSARILNLGVASSASMCTSSRPSRAPFVEHMCHTNAHHVRH